MSNRQPGEEGSVEHDEPREFPSLEQAVKLIVPYYQLSIQRVDRMDDRFQWFLGLVVGLTTAVPAFVTAVLGEGEVNFAGKPWFPLALVFFVLAFTAGMYGRFHGTLHVLDLSKVALHVNKELSDFQRKLLKNAARHTSANRHLVWRKNRWLMFMAALFLVESVFLLLWLTVA